MIHGEKDRVVAGTMEIRFRPHPDAPGEPVS